jgi:hypothetical protein
MDHITDHADRAVARLIQQYRTKVTYPQVVRLMTAEHQVLEDEFWLLYDERLDTATGEQLAVWGRIVGQVKDPGWDDDVFRAWIRIRILIMLSGGTGDTIIGVFRAVLADPVLVLLLEEFPAALTVRLVGDVPTLRWGTLADTMPGALAVPLAFGELVAVPSLLAALLRVCKAAGVRGIVEWLNAAPAETLTLDVGPGLDAGVLADAALAR